MALPTQSNIYKDGCDICPKKLKPGQEGVYVGHYLGNLTDKFHLCYNCYQDNEQECLQNYSFIYTYEREFRKGDTGYLKNDGMDCYADKKDQNGKILKQKDCSHCQPWKQKEIIGDCRKCGVDFESSEICYT
jgi:hypothetical protein